MAKNGPNKTVAAARRRMGGFPARAPRPVEPFMEWLSKQARAGRSFSTMQEAESAFAEEGKAPKRKLRDELPHEAGQYESVSELLDLEVIEKHDGCERGSAWPGPQRNVMWWYTLENGKRVGWNENPSVGWSFPVLGKARNDGAK